MFEDMYRKGKPILTMSDEAAIKTLIEDCDDDKEFKRMVDLAFSFSENDIDTLLHSGDITQKDVDDLNRARGLLLKATVKYIDYCATPDGDEYEIPDEDEEEYEENTDEEEVEIVDVDEQPESKKSAFDMMKEDEDKKPGFFGGFGKGRR